MNDETIEEVVPAYTISAIFRNPNVTHRLALFPTHHIDELESQLFDKRGRAYLTCLATGRARPAKPEEIVRQLWIRRLIEHYGYPLARITVEYPITFGR
jgi:type I restriction enzyme M protein